jgi:nucleoid-associated protein EbfC
MSDQGPDLGSLLQQAQQMQQQLMEAQAAAAEQVHEGVAGGGAVHITVTGGMEFRSVTIRPDAVDPDDVEMLQDLVTSAVNEALRASQDLAAQRMQAVTGGLKIPGLG